MSLVQNIKSLADMRGITIRELGLILEIGENAVYKWEKSSPKVETLQKVANYFGVTMDSLLAESFTVADTSNKEELKKFITSKGNEPYLILSAKAQKNGISPETLEKLIELYTKK